MTIQPTILVTGGAGYIGSHVCAALHEAGFTPVVLDNLSAGPAAALRQRVQWGPFIEADVRDSQALITAIEAYQPVAVMHFAALIAVGESVVNPGPTYDVNVGGSLKLLQAMQATGLNKLVFSSTAATYGTPEVLPIPESAPTLPINPYGHSKLMVEQMLADFGTAFGLKRVVLRYFNAAGARPELGLGYVRHAPSHLIPLLLRGALGLGPALQVMGTDYPTPDGTAIRDYLHVADLADAHVLALRHLLAGHDSCTLNAGTSQGASVQQVLAAAAHVIGQPVPHTTGPRRAGDPALLVADATQLQQQLGWRPARSSLNKILTDDWAWHQTLAKA